MRVHAFGVCDDEDYFYDFIDQLLEEAGASCDVIGEQPYPIGRGVHERAEWGLCKFLLQFSTCIAYSVSDQA